MTQETAKERIYREKLELISDKSMWHMNFKSSTIKMMMKNAKQALELAENLPDSTDKLSVEKLQEQLNTAKNALTEISFTRQEVWRGGTLVGLEATEDAKIAFDTLAAIGGDGCPVGSIGKNGLTKEELEGVDDE
ncbi:hypothetical protein [Lactococcus lactis]|uniref:Uncharacterized protein n=1 Tax=Lactococcus lactis subsp. lactis TaxID=1360 RepID=A0AAJ4JV62_LACLL|nr:hypothetical protein [Lactococcus lactis]QRZ34766.1 hypothetical protein LL223_1110 [Lactococcus lactis subsp. lactis]